MKKIIYWLWFDLRVSIAKWLLKRAVRCMPASAASLREAMARGMRQQEQYERYAGYTRLCGCEPWTFEMWRMRSERIAQRATWPGGATAQL